MAWITDRDPSREELGRTMSSPDYLYDRFLVAYSDGWVDIACYGMYAGKTFWWHSPPRSYETKPDAWMPIPIRNVEVT